MNISDIRVLPTQFYVYLFWLMFFGLSCSTDAFVLLKLHSMGIAIEEIPLLWAASNFVKMLSSFWGGRFSDRFGRKAAILIGWGLYAVCYFVFAFSNNPSVVIPAFLVYGLYFGLTEAAEKALVVDIVPHRFHGTGFGLFHFVVGITALPASLVFGWIWKTYSMQAAFIFGATLALIAAAGFSRLTFKSSFRTNPELMETRE